MDWEAKMKKQKLAACNRREETRTACLRCIHSNPHYPFVDLGQEGKCSEWGGCVTSSGAIIKTRCVVIRRKINEQR